MANREVQFSCPHPKRTAYLPTAGIARVQRQGPINQFDAGINVLAKVTQCPCGPAENNGASPAT
jgi:hypothetical protein